MNRLHIVLLGIFCVGVLLCGLGTGVAFTEFSKLTYGEKQTVGKTDIRTEMFDVEFEAGEEVQNITCWYSRKPDEVLPDKNVPLNTVRFCVTYNAQRVEPYAYWDEEDGRIALSCYWNDTEDEVELMMEAKDLVLQNLREGKIISFDVVDVEEVTILVNPASVEDVRLIY